MNAVILIGCRVVWALRLIFCIIARRHTRNTLVQHRTPEGTRVYLADRCSNCGRIWILPHGQEVLRTNNDPTALRLLRRAPPRITIGG